MNKYLASIPALFLAAALPLYAAGAPDPETLLDEMSRASRTLNYDGVFVYRQGARIDTMRIIHKAGAGGIRERLISLTGHAREMVRAEGQVQCYFPEDKAVVVEKSRSGRLISSYLPNPVQSISRFYRFAMAGAGRVAGRAAWIVEVTPTDNYRYGYQLWIDQGSRLLLKSELKDRRGQPLEQVMFTRLDVLEAIDEALLRPSVSAEDYTWYNNSQARPEQAETPAEAGPGQWQAAWMPAGFSMSEHASKQMPTSERPVQHLVYTDGLAMVSIFVEEMQTQPDAGMGASQMGGVNAYAVYTDGHQITAVGEVPGATVRQMADSVQSAR